MAVSRNTMLVLGLMAGVAVVAGLVLIPASPPDIRSPEASEFRYVARTVYGYALKDSCAPVKDWPREKFLAAQRRAIAEFASSHAGPVAAQLQFAHDDAALDPGCWDDSDPTYAKIHVALARTEVAKGLARMEQLAPQIGGGFLAVPDSQGPAAVFRKAAREAIALTDAPCTLSSHAGNETVLAAAQQELAKYRQGLEGARAIDFDIAEGDQLYEDSIAVPECAAPSDLPVSELSRQVLTEARKHIAALRTLP